MEYLRAGEANQANDTDTSSGSEPAPPRLTSESSSASSSGEGMSSLRRQLSELDMDGISNLVGEEEGLIEPGGDVERGMVEFVGDLRQNQIVSVEGVARVAVPMVAMGYPDDRIYVPGPVWEEGSDGGEDAIENSGEADIEMNGL